MKRLLATMLLSLVLIFGCVTSDNEMYGEKIEATDKIKDVKVSCFQKVVSGSTIFKKDYVYDPEYPPTVYLYMDAGWHNLNEYEQEERLIEIGRKWYDCNPDNNGPLTLMVYDVNDMPVTAIFLDRGE